MKKFFLFIVALCAVNAMATEGALSGKFSVSATKQVVFSQGNLQYQASTYIWQFAANQYDIVGADNNNIAADYTGWIDMFGWGTGNDPLKLSDDDEDYSVFNEWGANAISNGGNAANLWRTLTAAEMAYLFRSRTNAANLVGYAMIGSQHGLVVLPDDWTLPEGASFFSITDKGLVWDDTWWCGGYHEGSENHSEDNIYTIEQWETLETAGAVFLPMAGMRDGTMQQENYLGNYWTSTDGNHALVIREDGFLPPVDDNIGHYGCSVRLVQDYSPSTGIDDVQDNVQCTKVIRDGQIYILRGDKTYTVSGQEVK
ncbi:MAG: hypothetical protein J6T80_05160 [Paludibacteraceae bacterium]|nr:hypothetical protein [Paludibacteraceae bacterium]